jgi:serine/threonine-protein kinase HipA
MGEFVAAAEVRLWGRQVGAVAEDSDGAIAFEYSDDFRTSGLEISPRHLPLSRRGPVSFPGLQRLEAFQGLPGALADALPDRFGNEVIKVWFAGQGRPDAALSPVQRLLYIGRRAMGALEFEPAIALPRTAAIDEALELASLVEAARRVISGRIDVAVPEIMQLGASAGGARPKAVIRWNPGSNEVRSAFAPAQPGDEPWIIKFDGVGELDAPDPKSRPFNRIEYAYNQMASAAGLQAATAHLLEERRLAHFMTRRFDQVDGQRLHLHSLGGIDHADFNTPGAYSYEQYLRVILELGLPPAAIDEGFRRMCFNIAAVNQDDHVKNFAFLMSPDGKWHLAPAYDLTFASGAGFTRHHQLTLAGKRDNFTRADLLAVGDVFGLRSRGAPLLDQVLDAVADWPTYARAAKVPTDRIKAIAGAHRIPTLRNR